MTAVDRTDELARRLAVVEEAVADAAAESGRARADVTVVVVTKTWPASDLRILRDLGVRDFGENRHQEAEEKAAELAGLGIRWHFIGQIQSNKAARIAAYADIVHSVASTRVAHRLDAGARASDRVVECLVQANLDAESQHEGRGGVAPAELLEVARSIDESDGLRLRGLMGVAPLGGDASEAYARLAKLSELLRRDYREAAWVSAGMSGDFVAAVKAGATHVRVGSAVLGQRPLLG